jgi:heme/copper-type cytochrome/quinol oxidase subunit 3
MLTSEPTFYTKNRNGQFELWSPQTRLRRWAFPLVATLVLLVSTFLIVSAF